MEKVTVDAVENNPLSADITKRLSDTLDLSDMALNYYELEPGDGFTDALHTHMNQEEVFYVLDGTATFETVDDTHEVETDEAIRFAPGEYQQGRNESDGRVRALAFGAPRNPGESRVLRPCEVCGESEYHLVHVDASGITLECPECGNEIER